MEETRGCEEEEKMKKEERESVEGRGERHYWKSISQRSD